MYIKDNSLSFQFGLASKIALITILTLSLPLARVEHSTRSNHDYLCAALRLSEKKYTETHTVQRPALLSPGKTLASVGTTSKAAKPAAPLYNTPAKIRELTYKVAAQNGVDPHLVQAIIQTESNFNPRAKSPDGALGLMQLSADTARHLGVKNAFDPVENMHAGTRYLKKMLAMFKNNQSLAIAAYNAGPGNVLKYDGIPPFEITQGYVKKVLLAYNKNKTLAGNTKVQTTVG